MSYKHLEISSAALESLKGFTLPAEIGFGSIIAPIMITCDYKKGEWGKMQMVTYGPIELSPVAKVLHYAQEIFEGLKAYRVEGNGPFLFRADENAKRFNFSATRMAMPNLPEEMFLEAVKAMTSLCASFIPGESGESLYIRPFMFASEASLGIRPSEEFKFMVVASPSAAYFSKGTLPVLIEREATRACSGGTGMAKTGGNYACAMKTSVNAIDLGYLQTLWLDAEHNEYIEELSGMNFFVVIDGILTTPELGDTVLDGITRDSIITLARHKGLRVVEKQIGISELIKKMHEGSATEAFACGTAAIITPIDSLGEKDGTRFSFPYIQGEISKSLRDGLLAIQEGRAPSPVKEWVVKIELD